MWRPFAYSDHKLIECNGWKNVDDKKELIANSCEGVNAIKNLVGLKDVASYQSLLLMD